MTHEEMMARGGVRRDGAPQIQHIDPRMLAGDPTYIFNIYSIDHGMRNTGTTGTYYVGPCPEGQAYYRSPTPVPAVVQDIYPHFGEKEEYRALAVPGDDIVAAVLGISPGQNPDDDITRFGVFASKNKTPSKQELDAARAKLITELQRQVRVADQLYADADADMRKSAFDNKFFKAARFLNVRNKPWLMENAEVSTCKWCGADVRPDVPMCPGCHKIINKALYDRMEAEQSKVN